MKAYLDIVEKILNNGIRKDNRTGTPAYGISGAMFEHDMTEGFPLLTTKKMPFKMIASELEFFIKGITDKKWLQDRNNTIWNEWASPTIVPYGHTEEARKKMAQERDLGPVYGWQWRHFGAEYNGHDKNYDGEGVDQLDNLVKKIKSNPNDRRMLVTAWNPVDVPKMALPACHYGFQVTVLDNKLNLLWNQRSVDTMLGLPFNIASYAILLHLLAKESNLKEGTLTGFLADVHIYENHMEKAKEQLERDPKKYSLPKIITDNFKSIYNWNFTDTKLVGYESHPKIDFGSVAV